MTGRQFYDWQTAGGADDGALRPVGTVRLMPVPGQNPPHQPSPDEPWWIGQILPMPSSPPVAPSRPPLGGVGASPPYYGGQWQQPAPQPAPEPKGDRNGRRVLVATGLAIVAMLLAEIGLALISLAVPQLQVFFLAMPIKSALVLLLMLFYLGTLFEYGGEQIQRLREIVPLLHEQWRGAGT